MMKPRTHMAALGLLAAGSLAAAAATVLVLDPEDKVSARRGLALTALGFVFFPSLSELLNAAALRTQRGLRLRTQNKLACGDVMDINNKIVSAVQALLCCVTGGVVCVYSCSRDLLKTSHYMSVAYGWFGAAYFFYDIWSMYNVHVYMTTQREYYADTPRMRKPMRNGDATGDAASGAASGATSGADGGAKRKPTFWEYCRYDPVILFHHVFIGGFGFVVIVYLRRGLGDCVFGFIYLMELSTPLVSLRGALARVKQRGTLYTVNGVAMLVTFLFCRVLSMPYVMLMYSRAIGATYWEAILSLPTGCKLSILALQLPQLYWFGLMANGAVRLFAGKARKELTPPASAKGSKRS